MKLINYRAKEGIKYAIECKSGLIDVKKTAELQNISVPATLDAVIEEGQTAIHKLEKLLQGALSLINENEIVYAPCVTNPGKILCVGLNYLAHDDECKVELPVEPLLFSKFNNTLSANGNKIILPSCAHEYDYEAELVVVMGAKAYKISEEDALSYVFGYTVGNDLTARDLQFRSGQWLIGKSLDNFAPIGPCIVTADSFFPDHKDITCKLNGKICQNSNTREMIFSCAKIISYASQYMTLLPGDIIFTGTPGGVIIGQPEGQRNWIKSGDMVEVSIEGIGTLRNTFIGDCEMSE